MWQICPAEGSVGSFAKHNKYTGFIRGGQFIV
jgi:hypothetical protein